MGRFVQVDFGHPADWFHWMVHANCAIACIELMLFVKLTNVGNFSVRKVTLP